MENKVIAIQGFISSLGTKETKLFVENVHFL